MLEGLGEPFHETRMLIKDLQFQNGLERQRGELEILRERISLARELGLLDTPEARSAAAAALFEARRKRARLFRPARRQLEAGGE